MELFKPGKQYDFMKQRRFWIALSLFLTVASTFLALVYPGPNLGTDFRGGTEVEIAFKTNVSPGAIRDAVSASGKYQGADVVEVKDGLPNHFILRVQEVSNMTDATKDALRKALCYAEDPKTLDPAKCPPNVQATEVKFSNGGDKISTRYDSPPDIAKIAEQVNSVPAVKMRVSENNPHELNPRDHRVEIQLRSTGDELLATLQEKLGAAVVPDKPLRVEWVGGKAGKQLLASARNSVAIAIVFILIYLAFRFDLRFAPGVIIACIHDAMVVIGAFVLLKKEITLSTIAAVLTIVGYSMNDTVVVYDRIRENLGRYRGKTFAQVINLSVSETLSRTVLTSGATMLSVLAFFIWGTGVIKDFALAMVIGIVAGTYSSIYVAAPLTEWIDTKLKERSKGKKAAPMRPAAA
jgi:preprotein translocase subunit SecF